MGSIEQLVGSLLNWLHFRVRPPVCRNDWLSTITILGAFLALFPILAAVLVAIIRKFTGNRYTLGTCTVFGLIGALFSFLIPWLAFRGASGVFRDVATGAGGPGLSERAVASLGQRSCVVNDQRTYLGVHSVYQVLTGSHGGTVTYGVRLALLVAAPLLALLFVMLQGRVALRRGQKWPGRFLWLPVLALAVATLPLRAGVVEQLWLGFAPISLVGILIVVFAGKPRWSVINSSNADRDRPPAQPPAPYQPPYQPQYEPEPEYEPDYDRLYEPMRHAPEPLPPAPPPPPPPVLDEGRFKRVRTLGAGGFGTVWLAMDTHLDRTVAVKFAHVPDADTEERIRREAKALAAVQHPNCVKIYDIVVEPDGVGLVMEYIEGGLLSDVVNQSGRLDDVAAARLWLTMAGALAAAHEQGVLHRDVKPSNVIVDRRGVPHLIDFGIARSAGDHTLTSTGMMVGTPDYLAPEIARNSPPTRAADCWQLAATVSYALSGKPPRGRRADLMAAMMAAAQQEPCTELPTESVHARLLAAALDPDPARRPSLEVIRHEVSGWLARTGYTEEGPVATNVPIAAQEPESATRRLS